MKVGNKKMGGMFSYNLNYEPYMLACGKCGETEERIWNLPFVCFECEGRNYSAFFQSIKSQIKERDNFKCAACKKSGKIAVHHIDRNRRNNKPENLISLCGGCHSSFHSKKAYEILENDGIESTLLYIRERRKNKAKVFHGIK